MALWAVVPVKELDRAKERLASRLSSELRRALMLACSKTFSPRSP